MVGDWSFVVWLVVIAIPLGIALAVHWVRAHDFGEVMFGKAGAEDPRGPGQRYALSSLLDFLSFHGTSPSPAAFRRR